MNALTQKILAINGIDLEANRISVKEVKATMKKLKHQLKELEFLRRTGGLTLIVENAHIITTYMNNSLDRSKSHKKVIY